jgi:hypothetical protein
MLLEIDDETFDGLLRSRLIEDYKMIIDNICRLERIEHRSPGIQADIDFDRRLLTSMEQVLEYYIGHNWAKLL